MANIQRQDIAAGGILKLDGKVLMIKRSLSDSSPGYWEFPKGRVEFAESPEDAIKREFFEEVNLKVEPVQLYRLYSHTYTNRDGDHIHLVEVEYLVELIPGQDISAIKLDPEAHSEWRWVDKAEAEKLQPVFDDKRSSLLSMF